MDNSNKVKLFVYSGMQLAEDKKINKAINRNYKCGEVSVGASLKLYSKIINEEELSGMIKRYPDMKIIYKGKLSDVAYTNIDISYIS